MGFGIRSPVAIQAGTPFLEFTGEMQSGANMPHADQDYAYKFNYPDDKDWQKFVMSHREWTDKYDELRRESHKEHYYINPKYFGNVGRTALHSCLANAEVLRIYQKSLSPIHARLVLVAIEDIHPGVPISSLIGFLHAERHRDYVDFVDGAQRDYREKSAAAAAGKAQIKN